MDRSELIARTRRLAGVRMEALWPHRAVAEEVNDAYLEVVGLEDWPFLYVDSTAAVSAGASTVTLPVAMRSFSGVRIDGEDRLRQITVAELDRLEDPGPGQPEAYARLDDRTLVLWPEPDTAYTLSFRGWEATALLVNDSASPVFEAEFHPLIAYAAAIRILTQEADDSGRIQQYQTEATALLDRMRQRYLESHDRGMVQIGGRRSRRTRRWSRA